MNFREHYKYIDVELEASGGKNALGENAVCSYTVRMPLDNLLNAKITRGINTFDAISTNR